MTANTQTPAQPKPLIAERTFLAILAAVVALRVGILLVTPLSLHPDEAQYWAWSRELAWGYYSKPPLIAWIIAATTSVFGNAEWAARLASPFLHGLTAWLLYRLGRRLYGPDVGAMAGVGWLMIPSVWLSSVLVSTDAALLPLWALALLAFDGLIRRPTFATAALLGFAVGAGALAKYAMLYFPLCAGLAALWLPDVRKAIFSRPMALAVVVAGAILAPNLIWNAQNDFATLSHTVANANLGADDLVNVDEASSFLIDQIAMAGLLTLAFVALLVSLARRKTTLTDPDRFLLAFVLPPLLVILAQSLLSRAHANWAAAAYPALVVLTTAWLAAPSRRAWLAGVTATHAAIFAAFAVVVTSAGAADALGLSNALKRLRGWDATAAVVEEQLVTHPSATVMVDHRHLFFELKYQWRDKPQLASKLRMWVLRSAPGNHAELMAPMRPSDPSPVLVVQMSPRYERFIAADFAQFAPLSSAAISLGGGKVRQVILGAGSQFTPRERTPDLLREIGR